MTRGTQSVPADEEIEAFQALEIDARAFEELDIEILDDVATHGAAGDRFIRSLPRAGTHAEALAELARLLVDLPASVRLVITSEEERVLLDIDLSDGGAAGAVQVPGINDLAVVAEMLGAVARRLVRSSLVARWRGADVRRSDAMLIEAFARVGERLLPGLEPLVPPDGLCSAANAVYGYRLPDDPSLPPVLVYTHVGGWERSRLALAWIAACDAHADRAGVPGWGGLVLRLSHDALLACRRGPRTMWLAEADLRALGRVLSSLHGGHEDA